jgi:Domain of unknown function (DUF6379)
MLEHQLIQSTGFNNIGPVGARTGFAVRIRIPNYHGSRLAQLDGFTVTVDGEVFPFEQNRFAIRGKEFTLAEMREELDERWGLLEHGTILVDKPGGLTPGVHEVEVLARIRYSYFPPDMHIFPMHAKRMATIVLP